MNTLSDQDFELAKKHSLWMQQFNSKHEFNAIYFTSYELAAFLAARDAIKHKELLAIHEVVQCIGCVKEVLPTDSVTVKGVKMMAIRLNEREE